MWELDSQSQPLCLAGDERRDERFKTKKNLAFVWFMELGLGSCIISQDERL